MLRLRIRGEEIVFAKNSITHASLDEMCDDSFELQVTTTKTFAYKIFSEEEARKIFNQIIDFINQ